MQFFLRVSFFLHLKCVILYNEKVIKHIYLNEFLIDVLKTNLLQR